MSQPPLGPWRASRETDRDCAKAKYFCVWATTEGGGKLLDSRVLTSHDLRNELRKSPKATMI